MRDALANHVYLDTRGDDGDSPPMEFDTDMGQVPEALDMCVRLMTPTELATVNSTSVYAYDGRTDRPEART